MQYPGRTIQIFLPFGSPRGIKIAEITNRTVQAIYIPRNELAKAEERLEVQNVGVYYLFGQSDEESKPQIYIGEAENCFKRLKEHNRSKDFWDAAIVFVTNNQQNQFTKTDVKFLEHQSFQKAQETKRYKFAQTIPQLSFVPEWRQADLQDIFETIKILLATLGYPVFEPMRKYDESDVTHVLTCRGKGVEARGEYNDEGLVVFKGSEMNPGTTKSSHRYLTSIRQTLWNDGIVVERNGRHFFQEDHQFSSPSQAASVILGRSANGWTEWKNEHGQTLDELKRRDP